MNTTKKTAALFDPERSLFSLPAVLIIIATFAISSIISAAIIATHTEGISTNLSGDGFNEFVKIFQVPIALLGVCLALVGICGANHRSEQSRQQMWLTSSQNRFSNHFKHLEEFEKYLSNRYVKSVEAIKRSKVSILKEAAQQDVPYIYVNQHMYRALYRYLFPGSNAGQFEINSAALEKLDTTIEGAMKILKALSYAKPKDREALIVKFSEKIDTLCEDFYLNEYPYFYSHPENSPLVNKLKAFTIDDLLWRLQLRVQELRDVFFFNVSYEPSALVSWIFDADFDPECQTLKLSELSNEEEVIFDKFFQGPKPYPLNNTL